MHKNAGETYLDDAPFCVFPMCTVYRDSSLETIIYTPSTSPSWREPTFENFEDSTTFGNTLVTGEFTYFYFKAYEYNNEPHPIWLYIHDVTNFEPPSYDYVNDSTSVWIDLRQFVYNSTGVNYVYNYLNSDGFNYYALPSVNPFGKYQNNHTYQLDLLWTTTGSDSGHKSFRWTTNFSTAGATLQETNSNDPSLTDTNKFYNDLTLKGDLIKLPQLSVEDPTYNFFSTLVTKITNAFYSASMDETLTFEFLGEEHTIHSTDFNFLSQSGLQIIRNLLALWWMFAIGYYLFCDIRRIVFNLKEFHWSLMFEDDISVKML